MKPAVNQKKLIRLNKYISDSGIASRRKSEEYILQDRVSVNNKIINSLNFKIDPETDKVYLDGELIHPKKHIYLLMNKPKGVITSTSDEKKRKTVIDLVNINEKIYPVGRLDYNTTGVLILTNDGDFSNLLTHPRNNVRRLYEVNLDKPLNDNDKEHLLKGVYILGRKGKFLKINFPKTKNKKFIEIICVEGRNHFVKNMFNSIGYSVTGLNRKQFAGLTADVAPGKYRKLSQQEVNLIKRNYDSKI
jgi:23S rRNA pseudouridine2605 synthase